LPAGGCPKHLSNKGPGAPIRLWGHPALTPLAAQRTSETRYGLPPTNSPDKRLGLALVKR